MLTSIYVFVLHNLFCSSSPSFQMFEFCGVYRQQVSAPFSIFSELFFLLILQSLLSSCDVAFQTCCFNLNRILPSWNFRCSLVFESFFLRICLSHPRFLFINLCFTIFISKFLLFYFPFLSSSSFPFCNFKI